MALSRPLAQPARRLLALGAVVALAAGTFSACGRNAPLAVQSARAGAALGLQHQVRLSRIELGLRELYQQHQDLSRFSAQDVEYSQEAFDGVLRSCTQGSASTPQAESDRLLACAPLIFFLYSYGKEHPGTQASMLADEIYSFALEDIHGPLNVASVLGGTLSTWGVPVASTPPSGSSSESQAVLALVSVTQKDMLSSAGVHVEVTGYQERKAVDQIAGDIGRTSAREDLRSGAATASIIVTPSAAYIGGNVQGLVRLIGLPVFEAKVVGSRWVKAAPATPEYKDLALEDTLGALPTSILPANGETVGLSATRAGGVPVEVLSWQAALNSTGTEKLRETLYVTPRAHPLPLREVTVAGADTQVDSFSRWGERVIISQPMEHGLIAYSALTGLRHK